MMYLDQITAEIRSLADDGAGYTCPGAETLYRLYAVLCLAKGGAVTAEDVHNAWSVWAAEHRQQSIWIKPFADLPANIRAWDEPWAAAIREVARQCQGVYQRRQKSP